MKRKGRRKKFKFLKEDDYYFQGENHGADNLEWFERVAGFNLIFGESFMQWPKDMQNYQMIVAPSGEWYNAKTLLDDIGELEFGNRKQIETFQAWEYLQLLNNLTKEQKADRYPSLDEWMYYDYLCEKRNNSTAA